MATGTGSWVGGDDWYAKVDASVTTNSAASAVITVKCICVSQYGTTSGYSNIQGATAYGSNSYNWGSATSISTNSTKTLKTSTYTITKTHAAQSIKCWAQVKGIAGTYSGSTSTATVNVTVSAKTSYAVSYNGNGATSGSTAAQTKWYGETLALRSNGFARTGYTFVKWNTKADGTGTSYNAGANYTGNAAVTLYAIWKANTWTVAYNANKPSEAAGSVTNLPASQTKTYGTTLKLSSNVPVLPLYNFLGYATSASGAVAYQPGGNYTSNAAATLYAKWELAYTVPSPPIDVTATNIYDGVVSDTQCTVSFTLPDIPDGDMAHRTGYKIYLDGTQIDSVSDSTQTSYTVEKTLTFGDHTGKTIVISVSAVGEAGESTKVAAATLYGTLAAPSVGATITRGWSSQLGYYATINVTDNPLNAYPHSMKIKVNGVDEYVTTGMTTITSVTGDSSWVNSILSVTAQAVPTDSSLVSNHTSAWSSAVSSPKATYAVSDLDVSQIMSGGIAHAGIVFDGADGEDSDTTYVLTFDNNIESVTINYHNSPSKTNAGYDDGVYSYLQQWMGVIPLNITVTAYRNGFASQSKSISFTYVPQNLKAPSLISVVPSVGATFVATYSEARDGIPINDDSYTYKLYLNGEVVAETDEVVITGGTHTISFNVYDPNRGVVQMKAFDQTEASIFSNAMTVRRTVPNAGIYAYQTKLDMERVRMDGVEKFMVTRGVYASVGHCVIEGEAVYNMETETDEIIELDNQYTIVESE